MCNSQANAICYLTKTGAILLAWILTASFSAASPTVTIASPAEGTAFHPGQAMSVTVDATPLAFKTVIVVGDLPLGFSQILTAPPYRFRMQIPLDTVPGPYTLAATGVTHADTAIDSEPVTVAIERPDSPRQLKPDPSTLFFDYIGDYVALGVDGTFSDGSNVELTRSTLTTWVSSNPAVATVDTQGVVTAMGPGSAKITITNRNATAVVPVTVPHQKPLEKRKP
jgi:hypothetical protein